MLHSSSSVSKMNIDEFLSPFSDFTPNVGATLREFELEEASDNRSSAVSTNSAASIIRIISDVENLLASHDSHDKFGSLREEWRDLLGVVFETGMMIKSLSEHHAANTSPETFDLELHRLTAMSKAATIVADMRCPDLGGESASPSTVAHTDVGSLEMMMTVVKEAEQAQTAQSALVDAKVRDMEACLESEVDKSLDSFSSSSMRAGNSSSIEFALTSSHEEIDAIKSSNSMRWLNDVLKWQVLDMNIQLRQKHEAIYFERLIKIKKEVIREVIRNKVRQSMSTRKLELAKSGLDNTIDALYRISTASVSSTAASSPPTVEVFKQMVQSPQVKLEEAQLAEKFSDMNRCLAS